MRDVRLILVDEWLPDEPVGYLDIDDCSNPGFNCPDIDPVVKLVEKLLQAGTSDVELAVVLSQFRVKNRLPADQDCDQRVADMLIKLADD